MICSRCQAENPSDASFCDQCGTRLDMACPNCGEANRRTAKFCKSCGQSTNQPTTPARQSANANGPAPITYVPKHLTEKIFASRQTLEGERKHVTVLFADIRGSTGLIEGRDPEDAQRIIDPVLHLMMKAVHRYEGTVNQVLGDGIMALFGAPVAHEDHALRACYAALAMREEMRRHNASAGDKPEDALEIGIGLNSGEVVVRSIDNDLNMDYSALGQTTHLAARMQELASGNAAILTAATLREVEGFIEVKPLGRVQAKGVTRAIDAYELLGATPARTRVQAGVARGLTQFVGRSAETQLFQNLVECAASGRGQILAMVGEPGMGKSRLVYEFTRSYLPAGWVVFQGASVSYGKATPYFPLAELLRRYFAIADGDSPKDIQEKVVLHVLDLDRTLKEVIPPILSLLGFLPDAQPVADDETPWITRLPDLAAVANKYCEMEPQQRRHFTLEALKRLFVRESQIHPLLLVFEDLHWIDNETQAVLDNLVDLLPMSRMLLLVNYRPGYLHRWGDKTYYTQIRVDPLGSSSADELIRNLLGNHQDLAPLKELLRQRTEGNPFFIEESVRSLLETGVLVGEKGAYRPGLRVASIQLPNTVQNIVADRIDRLPIEEKHLLQTAAVIGVIVPAPLLRDVSELPEASFQSGLTHLQAAEFLYESNLFPEKEYTFKHALMNEVAYSALIHSRKVFLHAKIVNAFESTYGANLQEQIETVAQHAYRGELWNEAMIYSWQAGRKASGRSANQEAREFFQSALAALNRLPQTKENLERSIDLRFDLRNTLFLLNEFQQGFEHLEEAKKTALAIDDQDRLGKLYTWMTAYWNLEGNSEQAVLTGHRALDHSLSSTSTDCRIVAHYFLGVAYHNLGQFQLSIEQLRRALALIGEARRYELFGTTGIVSVVCKGWLIRGLAQIGEFDATAEIADNAIRTAEDREHPFSIAYANCAVGTVALLRGELDRAILQLERALQVCQLAGIPVLRPLVVSSLAAACALAGNSSEASVHLASTTSFRERLAKADERQLPFGKAMRLVWEILAFINLGRDAEAETLASHVLSVAVESKDKGSEAWLQFLIGDILRRRRAWGEAQSRFETALELARAGGLLPLQAHSHLGLGSCQSQLNHRINAETELNQALAFYRRLRMPYWSGLAEGGLTALR